MMLYKVFFELCVSFLVTWAMWITELVKGDIFDTHLKRFPEPSIDKSRSSLYRIGFFACKGYKMHRVIANIIETSESCHGLIIFVDEPLTYLAGIK